MRFWPRSRELELRVARLERELAEARHASMTHPDSYYYGDTTGEAMTALEMVRALAGVVGVEFQVKPGEPRKTVAVSSMRKGR